MCTFFRATRLWRCSPRLGLRCVGTAVYAHMGRGQHVDVKPTATCCNNMQMEKCDYVLRRTVNRKEGIDVQRNFVQGTFVKPSV